MSSKSKEEFRFQRNDNIGTAGAEEDKDFLSECFVDTGDSSLLSSPTNHQVIILGRTGTGKTALLKHLEDKNRDRVISIKPDNLALRYISNSTILNFFTELGVNLDPFFKLLWRHVFTIEILTRFFDQNVPVGEPSLYDWLRSLFPSSSREDKDIKQAVDYLEDWGSRFWDETEYRVKEITQKVEKDLEASLDTTIGIKSFNLGGKGAAGIRLSDEQKSEILQRGQNIISDAQVRDLHQVTQLLGKVLTDKQKSYYIVLDGLDENWVDERLRHKLIMALIETAKEFIQVENAKIIIALRLDLLTRVFRQVRDLGFQEEKFQSLYLPLTWSRRNILEILDLRVRRLVSRRYTNQKVSYTDLLPNTYRGKAIGNFIYEIAKTPRDVISLFNACILAAIDKGKLSESDFTKAIGEYSRLRLRALGDEWFADYPTLLDFSRILNSRPRSFKVTDIKEPELSDISLEIVTSNLIRKGELFDEAQSLINGTIEFPEFRKSLLLIFYRVGLIGLKIDSEMSAYWVSDSSLSITRGQITDNTSAVISPKYAIALGVKI